MCSSDLKKSLSKDAVITKKTRHRMRRYLGNHNQKTVKVIHMYTFGIYYKYAHYTEMQSGINKKMNKRMLYKQM